MFAYAAPHLAENIQAGVSAKSSSFYMAMRILPTKERAAMYEIYHFCHAVDAIADDDQGHVEARIWALEQWRRNIGLLYTRSTPPSALRGLAAAISAFGLLERDFLAVIEGMAMDVQGPIQAPDTATLALYCDCVACAVGRLSVRVFGLPELEGTELAHHLGMALQLTNILRDIDEDRELNRLYLPRELLDEAGINSSNPKEVLSHPAIANVCIRLAGLAAEHFDAADRIMKRCECKLVRTPLVMSHVYHAIHTALLERGFAWPRQKIRLGRATLGVILVKSVLF